jgi:chitodextrinase
MTLIATLGAAGNAAAVFLEARLVNPSGGATEAIDSTSVTGPVGIAGQLVLSSGTVTYNDSTDHGQVLIEATHFKANSSCTNVTRRHAATMRFDDVVIACPDSAQVNARLRLGIEGYAAFTGTNRIGTVQLDVTVRLGATTLMVGRWIPRSSFSSDVSSGIFASLRTDTLSGLFTTPVFRVPVGQPLTLAVTVAADIGAGGCNRAGGDRAALDFSGDGRRIGLPITGPVFVLPAGGNAQSADGRIVDNVWTPVPPNTAALCNTGGPYAGVAGAAVPFDASASADADGQIVSYAWDFGDGAAGSGMLASHAYAAPGTYGVSLTVMDDDGAVSTCQTAANVVEPPNQAALCDGGGPYEGVAGAALSFDASGSSDADGQIVSYEWTFGDGSTGNGASAQHAYAAAGAYAVSLCVTDDDGARTCCETQANVAEPPRARLALDMRPGNCENPLNPRSLGVIPAAIVGGRELSVVGIDPASIRLAGRVAPLRASVQDVATAAPARDGDECPCTDQGADGIGDLALKFDTEQVVAALDPATLVKGERVRISVTGTLLDGTPFEATDCMLLVQDGYGRVRSEREGGRGKLEALGADPNPFMKSTEIRFSLEQAAHVRVTVYDVAGRVVQNLVDSAVSSGEHALLWDAGALPSGVYFYRIEVDGEGETRKVVLAR